MRPPVRRRHAVSLRDGRPGCYRLRTVVSNPQGVRMLVRSMCNRTRRGVGRLPAAMAACMLGATALASPGAAQDDPGPGEAIPYFIDNGAGIPGYQPSDDELARAAFEA